MTTTDTRMARARTVELRRSSPRKRGPRTAETQILGSSLYRLMAWLSPAYPVGAFSYSSGLEWAVEAGDVTNADTLCRWLKALLSNGVGCCDAVLFAHAYRACEAGNDLALCEAAELAAALASSRERFLETTGQGRAFLDVTQATWPCPAFDYFIQIWSGPIAYPVSVAVAAAGHQIPLEQSLAAYLQAVAANWISAGVRLIPLGQTDGQRVTAMLERTVAATTKCALAAVLDDAGSAVFRADIAVMRHETQYTRLFRS